MNINALRKNLDTLEGDERLAAEALLTSLGISWEKKPTPTRSAFTTRLKPYVERVGYTCRTCDAKWMKHFHYTEHVTHGQHYLSSVPIDVARYNELTALNHVKMKKTGMPVCKDCASRLAEWPVEVLVATLLNIRIGNDYKKVEVKHEATH